MHFPSHLATTLQRGKNIGLHSELLMFFASIGLLLTTASEIALFSFGLSCTNILLISVPLGSIFTSGSLVCFELFIWPRLQGSLSESGDKFKNELFLRERLFDRVRIAQRFPSTQQMEWLENSCQEYFGQLNINDKQIVVGAAAPKPVKVDKSRMHKSKIHKGSSQVRIAGSVSASKGHNSMRPDAAPKAS